MVLIHIHIFKSRGLNDEYIAFMIRSPNCIVLDLFLEHLVEFSQDKKLKRESKAKIENKS